MFGALFLGLLLPRLMLAFGAEDPVRGKPFYHEKLTRDGAREAIGWADTDPSSGDSEASAVSSLAWQADYVDSYLYNWVWNAGGGVGRAKSAVFAQADLVKVHFDDLTSTAQIERMWNRYLAGTVAGLLWAAERQDVPAARHIVGVSLHAAQDFYSHSNWVDDPKRRGDNAEKTGTWFDFTAGERGQMFLYTGTYELPDQHGFKHHSKIAIDCKLMHEINDVLDIDAMDILCSGFSPLAGTGLCRRWQECKQNSVPVHPDVVLGVDVPDGIVYLGPPGIALDSKWLSQVNVLNRDLPELTEPNPDNKALGLKMFGHAEALAQRHTRQWLGQLDDIMAAAGEQEFWNLVKTRPRSGDKVGPVGFPVLSEYLTAYAEDAHQFEHANKLPLTFLSAGKYPPSPLGDDEGWFVRLQLRTADDEFGTGTDSDVDVEIGGRFFRLDHGWTENRLLGFDDFESGDDTFYVVGPFDQKPTSMRLINNGTSVLDLIGAALADLSEFVSEAIHDIGKLLLSLIGGNEDYVGSDKMTWSWEELEALVGQPGETEFVWHVDGGDEGKYDLVGRILVERLPNGSLRAGVRPRFLRAIEESSPVDADETPFEDEVFILMLVNSPAADQIRPFRSDLIFKIDSDETHPIQVERIEVDVPRHGGLIVPIQIWESDLEPEGTRNALLRRFLSEYEERTEIPRSAFLDAIGEAILPDWKLAGFDAFAYRRGAITDVATLASNRQVNQWIEAGRSLTLDFDPSPIRRVVIESLLPSVDSFGMVSTGSVNGLTSGPDGLFAVASTGPGTTTGQLRRFGTHLEPGPVITQLPAVRSVTFDGSRNRIFVLHQNGTVGMYDASSLVRLGETALGFGTIDIAVDDQAGLVYVSVWGIQRGEIVVLSADDLTERHRYTNGDGFLGPQGLAVSSDPRQLYVARTFASGGLGAPTVTAFSVFDVGPSGALDLESTLTFDPVQLQPIDVAVDDQLIYLGCLGANVPGAQPRLVIIRRLDIFGQFTNFQVVGEVMLPSPVRAVASRPGTAIAYAVGEAGLMFVDTNRMEHVLTVPLGRQSHSVAVDAATGTAYVGDRLDGTISRVDAPSGLF